MKARDLTFGALGKRWRLTAGESVVESTLVKVEHGWTTSKIWLSFRDASGWSWHGAVDPDTEIEQMRRAGGER